MPLHNIKFLPISGKKSTAFKKYADFSIGLLTIFKNTGPSAGIILFLKCIKMCIY